MTVSNSELTQASNVFHNKNYNPILFWDMQSCVYVSGVKVGCVSSAWQHIMQSTLLCYRPSVYPPVCQAIFWL